MNVNLITASYSNPYKKNMVFGSKTSNIAWERAREMAENGVSRVNRELSGLETKYRGVPVSSNAYDAKLKKEAELREERREYEKNIQRADEAIEHNNTPLWKRIFNS